MPPVHQGTLARVLGKRPKGSRGPYSLRQYPRLPLRSHPDHRAVAHGEPRTGSTEQPVGAHSVVGAESSFADSPGGKQKRSGPTGMEAAEPAARRRERSPG